MKIIRNKLFIITLMIIATITPQSWFGTVNNVQTTELHMDHQTQLTTPWLTVWIHGTRLTPKIFFKEFFYVAPGLTKATDLDPKYHHHGIAQALNELDHERCDLETFYLYGWSGKLSFSKRQDAAQELYKALTTVIADYSEKHGVTPKVRIITHSHGGNVALNLAHYVPEDSPFSIDELVLLACPVQKQTKDLIKHSIFKNVYSLYSKTDMLQVADPQGIYMNEYEDNFFERSLFSERLFPENPKLKQAEITYNGRGILHVEFLLVKKMCGFVEHLPKVLETMSECPQALQNISLSSKK